MAATMDDLIASLSGTMHVSQDGYDLKALQDFLAQTIAHPSMSISPSTSYRPIPSSRSTSSTRKPSSLPSSYYQEGLAPQVYPSPLFQSSFAFNDDPARIHHQLHQSGHQHQMVAALPTPTNRPGALRRSSSYGFAAPPSPAAAYTAFESDAFAPLWQEQMEAQTQAVQDPWARMRNQHPQRSNAFDIPQADLQEQQQQQQWKAQAISGPGPSSFGTFRPAQGFGQTQFVQRKPPTPPVEDDEMDEDDVDEGMDEEEEEEERVERVMGLTIEQQGAAEEMWTRGRRKS